MQEFSAEINQLLNLENVLSILAKLSFLSILAELAQIITPILLIISLILVQKQITYANKLTRISAIENRDIKLSNWSKTIIENEKFTNIWIKARLDLDCLSESERTRFNFYMLEYWEIIQEVFLRYKEIKDNDGKRYLENNIRPKYKKWPCAKKWINKNKSQFNNQFIEFLKGEKSLDCYTKDNKIWSNIIKREKSKTKVISEKKDTTYDAELNDLLTWCWYLYFLKKPK